MKKTKKNKASKNTLLGGAGKSLKKLGKGGAFGKLSTTQKVVGGAAALLAVGVGILARRRKNGTAPAADVAAAEESLAAMDESAA